MAIPKLFALPANTINKFKQFPLEICYIILLLLYLASKISFSFILEKTLLEYVYAVTNVNCAKNKTTKYFNFNTQSEEEN